MPEQRFIDAAKELWRNGGYDNGAIKTIAELLERIERIMLVNETRLDEISDLKTEIIAVKNGLRD